MAQTTYFSTHDPACDSCRIKKIRCGRERPSCSNCQRSGIQCLFTNSGKRPSQAQKVLENFEDFDGRLGRMEENIALVISEISRVHSTIRTSMTPPIDFRFEDQVEQDSAYAGSVSGCSTPHHLLCTADGAQYCYGPMSLFALCNEALQVYHQRQLGAGHFDTPPSADEASSLAWSHSCDLLEPWMNEQPIFEAPTLNPITAPPIGLVTTAIESYFETFNPLLPLFDKDTLAQQARTIYENPSSNPDAALAVCLNFVVLCSLRSHFAERASDKQANPVAMLSEEAMESEILRPFVDGLKRSINRPDLLFQPRIASIKAFVTLYFIARDHCHPRVVQLVLSQAVSLAKCMGLHQANHVTGGSGNSGASASADRIRLFWILRDLDISHSQTYGAPKLLDATICDVQLPSCPSDDVPGVYFAARIALALLQENIHKAVQRYQKSDANESSEAVADTIAKWDAKLQDWKQTYPIFFTSPDESTPASTLLMQADMQYCFSYCQILLNHGHSPCSPRAVDESRAILQYMKGVYDRKPSPVTRSLLTRIMMARPLLFFFILFNQVVDAKSGDSLSSDLELMHFTADLLGSVQRTANHQSYPAVLARAIAHLCQIADGKSPHSTTTTTQPQQTVEIDAHAAAAAAAAAAFSTAPPPPTSDMDDFFNQHEFVNNAWPTFYSPALPVASPLAFDLQLDETPDEAFNAHRRRGQSSSSSCTGMDLELDGPTQQALASSTSVPPSRSVSRPRSGHQTPTSGIRKPQQQRPRISQQISSQSLMRLHDDLFAVATIEQQQGSQQGGMQGQSQQQHHHDLPFMPVMPDYHSDSPGGGLGITGHM